VKTPTELACSGFAWTCYSRNGPKMEPLLTLCATIEETQHLIKKPRAEVREEKKRGVEFSGHRMVKAAIERHPAMVYENQTDGCLPCQNGTAEIPRTRWRRNGVGAPPHV